MFKNPKKGYCRYRKNKQRRNRFVFYTFFQLTMMNNVICRRDNAPSPLATMETLWSDNTHCHLFGGVNAHGTWWKNIWIRGRFGFSASFTRETRQPPPPAIIENIMALDFPGTMVRLDITSQNFRLGHQKYNNKPMWAHNLHTLKCLLRLTAFLKFCNLNFSNSNLLTEIWPVEYFHFGGPKSKPWQC